MPTQETDQQASKVSVRSKFGRKAIVVTLMVLAMCVAAFIGYQLYVATAEIAAGLKRADTHIARLEAGDFERAQSELVAMLRIDVNDPNITKEELANVTNLGVQTGLIANLLKSTDAERYHYTYGMTASGRKLVTAYYRFDVGGKTYFYVVGVRRDDGGIWVLHSVNLETDKDPAPAPAH